MVPVFHRPTPSSPPVFFSRFPRVPILFAGVEPIKSAPSVLTPTGLVVVREGLRGRQSLSSTFERLFLLCSSLVVPADPDTLRVAVEPFPEQSQGLRRQLGPQQFQEFHSLVQGQLLRQPVGDQEPLLGRKVAA